jgi:DNA helicase II / ATP-dependent DNA helicase PcrA
LPAAHVDVTEPKGGFGGMGGYGGYGPSRFDDVSAFGSNYRTPGWQRAQARGRGEKDPRGSGYTESDAHYRHDDFDEAHGRSAPDINGGSATRSPPPERGRDREGVARAGTFSRETARNRPPLVIEGELIAKSTGTVSPYAAGDRVFHLKFGYGDVTSVEGNKLTIQFDKAGEKRVVDSFVERA